MSIADFFTFKTSVTPDTELPEIFPLSLRESDFVSLDVTYIYSRILTDVLSRTQGLKTEFESVLWDNCEANNSNDGLVTLLAKAMVDKRLLYLVFVKDVLVIREATSEERSKIEEEYKGTALQRKTGVKINFANFRCTDMMRIYSSLEYYTIASLSKNMNLAKAIQLKIHGLRSDVNLSDSVTATTQAKAIANGLKTGKDVMLDAQDSIVSATPDMTATNSAMEFINQKRSFYLGVPASYITGLAPKGLGDSGKGETKAIERGLKNYFYSIIKPVLEVLFDTTVTFRSDDFEQIDSALMLLKDFDLTSEEYLSKENKQKIVNKMFGLPEDAKGDAVVKTEPVESKDVVPTAAAV